MRLRKEEGILEKVKLDGVFEGKSVGEVDAFILDLPSLYSEIVGVGESKNNPMIIYSFHVPDLKDGDMEQQILEDLDEIIRRAVEKFRSDIVIASEYYRSR